MHGADAVTAPMIEDATEATSGSEYTWMSKKESPGHRLGRTTGAGTSGLFCTFRQFVDELYPTNRRFYGGLGRAQRLPSRHLLKPF